MAEDGVELRRSARLALTEIIFNETITHETPNKNVSADEMIIIQRGPRRRPITWSPLEEKTPRSPQDIKKPTETLSKRPSLNPKLRRRLILSPSKNSSDLGSAIAKKLKALPRLHMEVAQGPPELKT